MNDEQLILYYYDDGLTDSEKRAIGAALERDPELAARYRELTGHLSGWSSGDALPIADDLRQRLHAGLDRAADREHGGRPESRGRGHFFSFLLGTAVTAAVAVVVAVAIGWQDPVGAPPIATRNPGPATFARAMRVYFQDSRSDLEALPDTGNGDRTAMIIDLIDQNRAFARLATESGSPDLARVLRAFEPILVRLAADDITAAESAELRGRLGFELNVMLTKLAREASERDASAQQET